MKHLTRTSFSLAAVALFSLGTAVLMAQGNTRGEAKATVGSAHVSIDYGRPMLKGRDPLGMLKPGQVWRLGASAPTTLDSDQDLLFGNTRVPKGKHILLAKLVEPGKWVLLVSSKAFNEYEPDAKIAEAPMQVDNAPESVEEMVIKLSGHQGQGDIEVAWGTSRLAASFRVAP
ncbi:MAG TPA: DUF2911 domain-containing protein [Terriglobia bacterium]|nr:DUF2911 domain-containing protein [Terriglobia bacterium]